MIETTLAEHHASLAELTTALCRLQDTWRRELSDLNIVGSSRSPYPWDETHADKFVQHVGVQFAYHGQHFGLFAGVEYVSLKIYCHGGSESGEKPFLTFFDPAQCTEALAKVLAGEFEQWVAECLKQSSQATEEV